MIQREQPLKSAYEVNLTEAFRADRRVGIGARELPSAPLSHHDAGLLEKVGALSVASLATTGTILDCATAEQGLHALIQLPIPDDEGDAVESIRTLCSYTPALVLHVRDLLARCASMHHRDAWWTGLDTDIAELKNTIMGKLEVLQSVLGRHQSLSALLTSPSWARISDNARQAIVDVFAECRWLVHLCDGHPLQASFLRTGGDEFGSLYKAWAYLVERVRCHNGLLMLCQSCFSALAGSRQGAPERCWYAP